MWHKKQRSVQLEIFTEQTPGIGKQTEDKKTPIRYIRGYEKAVLMVMATIIVGAVFFSMGVNRGRYLATRAESRQQQLNAKSPDGSHKQGSHQQSAYFQPKKQLRKQGSKKEEVIYTIQVVTYRDKSAAEKEIKILKSRGFKPLVFFSGKYIQLCVGNFRSKEKARLSLGKLRKYYHDCFVRRL
jgi:hypothetical protein